MAEGNQKLLAAMEPRRTAGADRLQLLLCTVMLPMAVAAGTYLATSRISVNSQVVESTFIFTFFILEVGLVGVVLGKVQIPPGFRWSIYGWTMLLIDLLVCSLAMNSSDGYLSQIVPAAALFGAQIGLAIAWGILGTSRWYFRIPLTTALGAGLLWIWISWVTGYSGRLMTQVLVVQAVVLFLITAGLWVRGYRLLIPQSAMGEAANRRLQFGVRDVLVWTTVMAILLALMRGADMLQWKSFAYHPSIFFMSGLGLLSAMIILFSVWASLGQGHWSLRYFLLLLVLLAVGTGMGAASEFYRRARGVFSYRGYDYDVHRLLEVGWWWIAWMCLSGGLLTATLLIFRATGFRLMRSSANQPAAS